nr:hypothetical protein [Tanacetum cinerariifolium]
MVAYLSKSDASEGFNQIIDFLNESSIKYALTVNPNIYVSCIKQFWTSVAVKKVNDVTMLQALVEKKNVVITETTIRDALRLDDAEGVECLPNEEIFAELARMGYEKPSTKLTFYKVFFSSQWKFLIHTILQCMSAKRTSWNEFSSSIASAVICLSSGRKFNFSKYIFDSLVRNVDSPSKFYMYPRFLQLIIRKQVGDLSTHTTKYTSPILTQKVFANMRRVGKGFFGVETQLFGVMLVVQEVGEGDADEVHGDDVNAGDAAEGDVSAANDEVPTADEEPSIPSPTPPTPPPQPSQDIPSTSQVQPTSPQSSQRQPHPSQDAIMPMNLLQEVMDTYTTLTRRVEHLELDKIAQALEITKLKRRFKKLESRNKVKGRTIAEMDEDADVVLEEAKDVPADIAKADQDAKVLSMQEDESKPTEVQEVVEVVTTAKLITEVVTAASTTTTAAEVLVLAAITAAAPTLTVAPRRRTKGVVIRDPEESTTTTSIIIHSEAKSKDKGKGILVEEPKPLKKQAQIKLKKILNVADFKMDYFKGMSYDDIRPIFEAKFNLNVAFLQKIKEQIDEEESRALKRINETPAEKAAKRKKLDEEVEKLKRHLQIVPNEDDDVYTEATPLARKVPVVGYEIINQNNKPYYKIIRADGTHQLYISFLSLLRNFNRKDLEALWSLVKKRFSTTKPKNFSDDFLLITLRVMFEKSDIHAQIWKNQRSVHGPAKVKGWKLLESYGVQIITFTTIQLILLVERKYPLTRFTLDQMLNAVRLEVKEESEVSLELLREHERMILKSVEHGALIWPTVEENSVIRTKKYAKLSVDEKIQADCDMKATNIILQGTSLTKQERECKLHDAFDKFTHIKGESLHTYYLRFTQLINDMNIYKMNIEQFQVNTKFLNSLPPEWSKFVIDFKLVKDLHTSNYDQLHAYLEQHELHANESHMNHQTLTAPQVISQVAYQSPQAPIQLMTESLFVDSGFAVPVFSPGDDIIACLNKAMTFLTAVASSRFPSTNNQLKTSSNTRNQATTQDSRVTVQQVQGRQGQNYSGTTYKGNATSSRGNTTSGHATIVKCYNYQGEGHMARQCTQPKRQRNAAWYKEKAMLAEAQEAGQILNKEQLTEDLDTYDSDCDDLSNVQAVLIANISNYGSYVILEVVQIVLWYMDFGCSKHMTGNRSQLMNFVSKFLGTVRFGNDHIARIMGYGDY